MHNFPARSVGGISPATNFVNPSSGATGPTGPFGDAIAISYTFSTTTADADPGSGVLRLNNATQNTATRIFNDLADVNGADVTAIANSFNDSTDPVKGFIRLTHAADTTKWLLFYNYAMEFPGGYRKTWVVPVASSSANPFSNGDAIVVSFARTGNTGTATTIDAMTATATNDDATAGRLGEYVNATLAAGSATALVNNIAKTIISVSLTAGDWDVTGVVVYNCAATTTITLAQAGISIVNNTISGNLYERTINNYASHVPSANAGPSVPAPVTRISLSGTTTLYLIAVLGFAVSTATAFGTIRARRVR